jgi:hypothetical protein
MQEEECIHLLRPLECSLCRKAAGWLPGQDRQDNDCSVQAFSELTGASYTEALEILAAHGRKGGRGMQERALVAALEDSGFATKPVVYAGMWPTKGAYLVCAYKGRCGHAFTIVDGTVVNGNGWTSGVRVRVYRVA